MDKQQQATADELTKVQYTFIGLPVDIELLMKEFEFYCENREIIYWIDEYKKM